MRLAAAIKKTTTRSSWIKSAHNKLGWLTRTVNSLPITQRTCMHTCQGRLHSQLLRWLIGGHARIRQGQASPLMMFQALILLSTHSMRHHGMLIRGWLVISKMNVQLYLISKRTFTLFKGVWCFLTVAFATVASISCVVMRCCVVMWCNASQTQFWYLPLRRWQRLKYDQPRLVTFD